MPLWLLTGLGAVRSMLGRAWGWVTASSTHVLIVALVASLAFGLWERHGKHAAQASLSACESGRKADRLSYTQAQQEALRRALAAKAAQEADYRTKAERAEHDHTAQLASVRAATDAFIAGHRVRHEAPSSAPGRSPASPDNRDPGVSPPVPDDSFVAVTDADVRACSSATAYAVAARAWALSLAH